MMRSVIRIAVVALLAAPIAVPAQMSQISTYDTRALTLALTPENPGPGQTVTLSVQSYVMDLDRSLITWKANGKTFAEGEGLTQASIATGAIGTVTELVVEAIDDEGILGRAEARLAPSEIELLWTADSYAPPFFKGRRLAGTQATLTMYAATRFTNGTTPIPESNIIYTWYRDSSMIANVSGRGKSRVTLQGPARGTETISVVAETVDRSRRAEAQTAITAHDSKLVLYENHSLFGVLYHRAVVGDVNTIERELKITAVPYFARTPIPSALSYDWNVNGMRIASDPNAPETLVINAKEYTGPAEIALEVMSPVDILMRSVGTWRIIFSGSGGAFFENPLFGE